MRVYLLASMFIGIFEAWCLSVEVFFLLFLFLFIHYIKTASSLNVRAQLVVPIVRS